MARLTTTPIADLGDPSAPAPLSGSIFDWFLRQSRTYRLLLGIGLAILLYFFADEYTWGKAREIDRKCVAMEKTLREAKDRPNLVASSNELKQLVIATGAVAIPRAERDGTKELSKAVAGVMVANNTKYSLDVRVAAKLKPGALPGVAAPEERIEKVIGEMRFEAPQEVTSKIIAGLESRAEIESISSLKLNKKSEAEKKLQVQLTVEAWVIVPARAPMSSSASSTGPES